MNLSRREFFVYTSVPLLSSVLDLAPIEAGEISNFKSPNVILKDILNSKLVDIANIRGYEVSGAKKLIGHVLNLHYSEGMDDSLLDSCVDVQDGVYDVLSFLHDKFGLNNIYDEKIIVGQEDNAKEDNFRRASFIKLLKESHEDNLERKYAMVGSSNFGSSERELKRQLAMLGGQGRLNVEGILGVKGSTYGLNIDVFNSHLSQEQKGKIIFDDREDDLLRIVKNDPNVFVAGLWGALHAFSDRNAPFDEYFNEVWDGRISYRNNIEKWNERNKDHKYSLIEIMPS